MARGDTGHWIATGLKLNPEVATGFVYIIRERDTNRLYLGMKHYKVLSGKNKGKQSDWRNYCSSSKYLQERVRERGRKRFHFYILEEYKTLSGLHWAEVFSQVYVKVPEDNERWMNRFIQKISWKVTEGVTERHMKRLLNYLEKYPYNS